MGCLDMGRTGTSGNRSGIDMGAKAYCFTMGVMRPRDPSPSADSWPSPAGFSSPPSPLSPPELLLEVLHTIWCGLCLIEEIKVVLLHLRINDGDALKVEIGKVVSLLTVCDLEQVLNH